MKMDDSWYMEWYWTQATPDEKRLIDKVGGFEHLFEDMLFQEGTRYGSITESAGVSDRKRRHSLCGRLVRF